MPSKPPRDAVTQALAAKSKIEQRRATREPAGRVEEDGSYTTRDGRRYDPEERRLKHPKRRPGTSHA